MKLLDYTAKAIQSSDKDIKIKVVSKGQKLATPRAK